MAADQRKRRPSTTAATIGYGMQQYKAKKRDMRLPQYDFNFNAHISLKWDENGKGVVAKEEQVGISLRHLTPFVPCVPCGNTKLADVITVPKDVFELTDMAQVLSYEVWQSFLTEKERNFLIQFLPEGVEPAEVVQGLLSGENFHFGNPFLKWGASLCSGDLHPDAIVQHENSFKTNKKAYYSELQKYHDNMIRNLQNLKQRCASSKDPEAEILQIMSRSKRQVEKSILPDSNGHKRYKPEENVAAISESPSSIADEKLYYSDNQKLSVIRDAEIQRRIRNQGLVKDKHEKLTASSNGLKVVSKPKKAEKLQNPNMTPNDGAKYMSYVKISKKQYELVKNMKQSGTSIQSKALNRVLGSLDSSNVKPYEMFVEEEQKRIHEYWSNLANKDIPAALQNWRNVQLEKWQIMNSLWREMEEKLGLLTKVQDGEMVDQSDEKTADAHNMDGESSQGTSEAHHVDESATQGSISDNDKESDQSSLPNESPVQHSPLNVHKEFDPSSVENQSLQNPPLNVDEESDPSSMENQSLQNSPLNVNGEFDSSAMDDQSPENPSLNVNKELDPSSIEHESSMDNPHLNDDKVFIPMDLNTVNPVTSERSETFSVPEHQVTQRCEASLVLSHPETHTATAASAEEMPGSSVRNVWSSIGLPEPYQHTHQTAQYVSSSGQSLRHRLVVPDQPAHLIDLESNLPEQDTTKDLLNRHMDHMPYFNPYPNRDRNELLPSLIKRDSYHHEPKKTGLDFHQTSVLLEPTQFPSHFREQLQPSFALDHHGQKAQSELFMNQNIQDSIYSDNRYSIQGPGHFSTLNVRDWNNPRISTPIQSSHVSSGDLLNHNWFSNDNRAHGGWSGSDGVVFSTPSLGSGSSSDQSLYSVLSQCNTLRSRAPYNPVGSTEQMMPPTNYGQDMGEGIPMTSNSLPQTVSPFDYLSGAEASTTLKNPNMGWMSLGHQPPPALHDPSGKPFLKSWNQ